MPVYRAKILRYASHKNDFYHSFKITIISVRHIKKIFIDIIRHRTFIFVVSAEQAKN